MEENKNEELVIEEPYDAEKPARKRFFTENRIEVLVAILLGITALLTAWATWIGSLHGGNQATNYTLSNNMASEGNSEYNAAMQLYLSDMLTWNTALEYSFDIELAKMEGDEAKAAMYQEKMNSYIQTNSSTILLDAMDYFDSNTMNSPFEVEGMTDQYFVKANDYLAQSRALLEQGQEDNTNGDKFNLVTVIYSVVLFMLGIVGVFKRLPNRIAVMMIALVGLVLATIFMVTIPMPTGFSMTGYFAG